MSRKNKVKKCKKGVLKSIKERFKDRNILRDKIVWIKCGLR